MTEEVKFENWSKGVNNVSHGSRVPEGFARDMLNLYPAGGRISLRPGTTNVYAGSKVRGLFAVGEKLLCVDSAELKDALTGEVLATVPATGQVSGTVMNHQMYLSVGADRLIYTPYVGVAKWGVPLPVNGGSTYGVDPTRTTEQVRRGWAVRKFTLTQVDSEGVESGARNGQTLGGTVNVPEPTPGYSVRLYATEPDGSVYYLQGEFSAAQAITSGPTNNAGAQLRTLFMDAPPPADFLTNDNGCIVLASANFVYHTPPFQPHLVDLEGGFFMYPSPVTAMCGGKDGVYLSADKCYKLGGIGTDQIRQETVLKYPAVPGTMHTTPEGVAAWATAYGLALETPTDRGGTVVSEPTKQAFVPGKSKDGASGTVEHNGERLFVTNVRPDIDSSPLAAAGYFEAEVIRP